MTTSDHTSRPAAAGVFVVRDPAVCAALEQLLAPHRTDTSPSPAGDGSAAVDALMADAEAHASELTGTPTSEFKPDATIGEILAHVHDHALRQGAEDGRRQAATEGREWSEDQTKSVSGLEKQVEDLQYDLAATARALDEQRQLHRDYVAEANERQESTVSLQTDLAHADHHIADLERDLAKAKAVVPASTKVDGRTTRGKDRAAFVDLAARLEREALTQPKDRAAVLRVAAQGVRDEITAVYGPDRKAA